MNHESIKGRVNTGGGLVEAPIRVIGREEQRGRNCAGEHDDAGYLDISYLWEPAL